MPLLLHRPATFLDRVFQENPIETIEKVVVDTRSIVKELEDKVGKEKVSFIMKSLRCLTILE